MSRGAQPPRRVIVTAAPLTPNGDLHLGHCWPVLRRGHPGSRLPPAGNRCPVRDRVGPAPELCASHSSPARGGSASDGGQLRRRDLPDFRCRRRRPRRLRPAASLRAVRRHRAGVLHPAAPARRAAGPSRACAVLHGLSAHLFEAHVTGTCPHCGAGCEGNSCENCALPNTCTDLIDPVCNACGGQPGHRSVERLKFPLSEYAGKLQAFHAATVMSLSLRRCALSCWPRACLTSRSATPAAGHPDAGPRIR